MAAALRRRGGPAEPVAHPHVALARSYAESVVSGARVECLWVRLACQRYLRDIAREGEADWPYRFVPARAERVCRFVELLPHTKGRWAQQRQKLVLEPWQAWILCNVFGFVDAGTGLRRFRQSLKLVPRKNGKSALSAPVGLYMLSADGEFGAEVYSGATTEKQAWEVFRPALAMARQTPALLAQYGIVPNASNLHIPANGSRFEPLIGKPGDGASPSCAIVDEYHEHDTPEQHDTMLTGMGAREQPLLWIITTAGDNLAGPCFDRVVTGRKILQGQIVDEQIFYVEYTIDDGDDWTTEAAIRKANPNADVSVSMEFLLARQREAIRNSRDQGRYKTKHLNLWVNARSAFFNMESWLRCRRAALPLDELHGAPCVIGMDLASKDDIAALQVLFPLAEGRFATFGRYYLPESALEGPGREHYRGWAEDGLLVVTPGNMIDFAFIENDIEELRGRHQVDEVVFDPSQAVMLVSRLQERGAVATQFTQTAQNYSEPMKQVAALIDGGKLDHDCGERHPMTWMMSNVTARLNAKDEVFPRKDKDELKIDGPVALIMAMARVMQGVAAPSVYETRGLLVFG